MSKIDTTKYLRQMKYLPDITSVCNIFLIIVFIIFPGALMNWSFLPVLEEPPEMKYAHYYQPSGYRAPCVVINESGKVNLGDSGNLDTLKEIHTVFADYLEEMQIVAPEKIMIYADAKAPWGKIIDVLRFAKEKGINVAGFMMNGQYSILGYWDTKNLYREKGLKYPEIAQ